MSKLSTVICDVAFDVTQDKTEELLTAARRLVEAEKHIADAKAQLHTALVERESFVDGVLHQLLPTI